MNIFLDCGFYAGGALKKYIDLGVVDKTWDIRVFEPNPEFDPTPYAKRFRDIPIKIIKKAVWVKNGKVQFEATERENAAYVTGAIEHSYLKKVSQVPCIDFSEYVKKLPKDARIICSMDIEGSEYPVLEKMIEDGTIGRLDILDIEFHHRFILDKNEEDSQHLINKIQEAGVKIELKVPLI